MQRSDPEIHFKLACNPKTIYTLIAADTLLWKKINQYCRTGGSLIGAYLSKDAHASRGALQMLGCGCRRLNASMNSSAFMAQEKMVPPIFGFLTEIFRTHPRLTRRVAAINSNVASHASGGFGSAPQEPQFSLGSQTLDSK
jgi:hypothetical protein